MVVNWQKIQDELAEKICELLSSDGAPLGDFVEISRNAVAAARGARTAHWYPTTDEQAQVVAWANATRLLAADFEWDIVRSRMAADYTQAFQQLHNHSAWIGGDPGLVVDEAVRLAPLEWDPSHEPRCSQNKEQIDWCCPGMETACRVAARLCRPQIDWEWINRELMLQLVDHCEKEPKGQGVKDMGLDDEVIGETLSELAKSWRFDKEKDFDNLGRGLVIGSIFPRVAYKALQHLWSQQQLPPALRASSAQLTKYEQLIGWFNDAKITPREQVAFAVRFIYGAPVWVAGAILSPGGKTIGAFETAWYSGWQSMKKRLGIKD